MLKIILVITGLVGLIALAFVVKRKFGKTTKTSEEQSKKLDEKKEKESSKKKEFKLGWKDYALFLGGIALAVYLAVLSYWAAACLIFCLIVVALAAWRLVMIVPTNNVAIRTLFGRKRKGYAKEGLCVKLPFEKLPFYPTAPIPVSDIKIEATSKDDLKFMLNLSFEFCYDPSIVTKSGICVFGAYDDDDVIIKGITEGLKVIAESIIGASAAEQINGAKKEINLLLNVMARLSYNNAHRTVHPSEAINYYKDHFAAVTKELEKEHDKTNDHSQLEEKYGVDIPRVDLVIEYSDEARKILEKKKIAEEESLISEKIIKTVKSFKEEGLSPDKAASSALLIYKKDNTKLWIKDINIAGIDKLPEIIERAVKLVFEKEEKNA